MSETEFLKATDAAAVERAVALLRAGEIVALPTDTVYGLAAHAFLPQAVARLYRAKNRPRQQAIPLLLPETQTVELVCRDIPAVTWRLAGRFWPGAVSLVLWRGAAVPDVVTAGGPSVAVRVPDHPLVRHLCRQAGAPLAVTSANLHDEPAPVTAGEVLRMLGGRIPLLLDGGQCRGGVASTVLDLTVSPPVVLRAGPISTADLAAALSEE